MASSIVGQLGPTATIVGSNPIVGSYPIAGAYPIVGAYSTATTAIVAMMRFTAYAKDLPRSSRQRPA